MSDNVTPFRRPPKRPVAPQQSGGMGFKTHRGKAVLVHIMVLASFACGFLFPFPAPQGTPLILVLASCISLAFAFAAIALAMPNRYDAMPWAATHHEQAIRTLVIGYCIWVLASALTYISPAFRDVAFWIHLGVLLWAALRSLVGLVLAVMRKPIRRPKGMLL